MVTVSNSSRGSRRSQPPQVPVYMMIITGDTGHASKSRTTNHFQASINDWDSEEDKEIDHEQTGDDGGSWTEESLSTALVIPNSHGDGDSPQAQHGPTKQGNANTNKETKFQSESVRRILHVPHARPLYNAESDGNYVQVTDTDSYSDGSDIDDNGYNSDDIQSSRRRHHDSPMPHGTDLTHGDSQGHHPPDDAAAWLYKLVFQDDWQRDRRQIESGQLAIEAPRVVDRLLLQWTYAEQATEAETDFNTQITMPDPDPNWSNRLRSSISKLKSEKRKPAHLSNGRGLEPNLSSSSTESMFTHAGHPQTCSHGLRLSECQHADCAVNPYRERRPQITSPQHHYMPPPTPNRSSMPYSMYEEEDQGKGFQLHRHNKLLIKDMERLEATIGRMETLNRMEVACSERREAQLSKQYHNNVRDLKEKIAHLKATKEAELRALQVRLWEAQNERKSSRSKSEMACVQISALADRNKTWTPRLDSLSLSFQRVNTAPGSKGIIHGTVCWSRPFLPSLSELYQVLKLHDWKPLWMRGSSRGQTLFLGPTPILVNFFQQDYIPQIGKLTDQAGPSLIVGDAEDEYAAIGLGWVEREAIDELSLPYKGQVDGQYQFGVEMTHDDVESLLATSLLASERAQTTKDMSRDDAQRRT
ncbi:hypothetical protein K504DRAFT_502706 [Pleomassaria siparia CBS 279.74]|uniref:Uncharacterized protein n=1 Tax=Pleomassaria siparia CBS 279.74 TaxID=1314801 RepID=A0A6G1K888_9PLEO|nr:hypothetical protein K504DRAFT_502706 [Pleomassaria siparia CBS 279.74]